MRKLKKFSAIVFLMSLTMVIAIGGFQVSDADAMLPYCYDVCECPPYPEPIPNPYQQCWCDNGTWLSYCILWCTQQPGWCPDP